MPQVTNCLERLGMSEHAPRFPDNDIDFSILGDLTGRDLKNLGAAPLGLSPQDFARNCLRLT